jgi:glycosyltransferase involved in cell wall biosynthesis
MTPKISVIMPVYNCENYVAKAIESILNQSFKDFELIVIDGGSTDNTVNVIQKYRDARLRIVSHKGKLALADSRNEGLRMARGELIALQDADDVSDSQRLAKQYSQFVIDDNLAVLGTSYICIDENGRAIKKKRLKEFVNFNDFRQGMQMCHGSMMFRKKVVLESGGYDPLFVQCEDYELCCRLSRKGYKICNLNEFLYYLRVHEGSVSAVKWQEQILYACLVKDIYFGNLKKETVKKLPIKDHKHLYSILSFEGKKDYRLSLALKYIKSKKYGKGLNEFLKIAKLNPKEANRLIIKTIQNPRKIFNKTD